MSSVVPPVLTIPDDFTAQERFFVEKTQLAIQEGLQLERWVRDPNRKITEKLLNLGRPYKLENKAYGYFAEVSISGKSLTALGCRQEVEFGRISGPNAGERLKIYVLRDFLNSSRWKYDDGAPGGFTLKQMVYCGADGVCGRYSGDEITKARDYREIGTKYRWSLFTIFLHDFVVKMGPIRHTFSEAVAVVQHPEFVHIVENPRPGYDLEVAIGYPFIDYAPIPNYFGFGPGKFNWAIKTFSFLLRPNGEVRCDMDFVAGARPKKVFDFGRGIPDPFYGTSDAFQRLTFGGYKSQRFRDFMDLQMATQHGRVHQALMEGSSKVFASMLAEMASVTSATP